MGVGWPPNPEADDPDDSPDDARAYPRQAYDPAYQTLDSEAAPPAFPVDSHPAAPAAGYSRADESLPAAALPAEASPRAAGV